MIKNNKYGCIIFLIIIAIVASLFMESGWKWPLIIVLICALVSLKKESFKSQESEKIKKVNNSLKNFIDQFSNEGSSLKTEKTNELQNQQLSYNNEDVFEISYGSDDYETVRKILPKKISGNGHCLEAFCFLRNEYRTFNFDKIKWMKDFQGNVIEQPKFFFYEKFNASIPFSEYNQIDFGVNKFDLPDEILTSKENLRLNIEADYFEQTGKIVRYKMTVNNIRESSSDGQNYVKCELENKETRNLSTNKLTNIVNTDSGEIIDNLAKTIFEIYQNTPECLCKNFAKNFNHELNVLNFVARADGSLSQKEKDVIFQYFCNFKIAGLETKFIDKIFRGMKTDMADFKKSLKFLKNKENFNGDLFVECARGIVNIGKATELELATLKELESALAKT